MSDLTRQQLRVGVETTCGIRLAGASFSLARPARDVRRARRGLSTSRSDGRRTRTSSSPRSSRGRLCTHFLCWLYPRMHLELGYAAERACRPGSRPPRRAEAALSGSSHACVVVVRQKASPLSLLAYLPSRGVEGVETCRPFGGLDSGCILMGGGIDDGTGTNTASVGSRTKHSVRKKRIGQGSLRGRSIHGRQTARTGQGCTELHGCLPCLPVPPSPLGSPYDR